MKRKTISIIITMIFLTSALPIATSSNIALNNNALSDWSHNDKIVDLGQCNWSLANNSATVTAYRNETHCNLIHRGTRGLTLGVNEEDENDNYTRLTKIKVKFHEMVFLSSIEIRSLFNGTNPCDPLERGDIDLYLDNSLVNHSTVKGVKKSVSGNGAVHLSYSTFIDEIVFYVNQSKSYSSYSGFAIAKIDTCDFDISFVYPFLNIDEPDNYAPTANAGGPYYSEIGKKITFDGSNSYDPDGEIVSYKWYFDNGDNKTGEIVNYTYYSKENFTVTLEVMDNHGKTSTDTTYALITKKEDKIPPSVVIDKPKKHFLYKYNIPKRAVIFGTKIIGPINVKANVTDNQQVERVEFYLDEKIKHNDSSAPYNWWWITPTLLKRHTIKVKAYDTAGNKNTTQIEVKKLKRGVFHPFKAISSIFGDLFNRSKEEQEDGLDIRDPSVKIVKPRKHLLYKNNIPRRLVLFRTKIIGPIRVKVKAEDNEEIKKVEFYIDNNRKHTDRNSPYDWWWMMKPLFKKKCTLKVIAYDNDGNTATDQIKVKRERIDLLPHPLRNHPVFTIGGSTLLLKNIMNNSGEEQPKEREENTMPQADVNGPYEAEVGEEVQFDGSNSEDPDGEIVSYKWEFGDGNTSTGQKPSYIYSKSGDYTVTLTVTDEDGFTDTAETKVTVYEPVSKKATQSESDTSTSEEDNNVFWYGVGSLGTLLLASIAGFIFRRKYL